MSEIFFITFSIVRCMGTLCFHPGLGIVRSVRGVCVNNFNLFGSFFYTFFREIFILEPELWGTGHFGTGNRFPGTIRGEPGNWFPGTSSLVPVWFPLRFPGTREPVPGNRFPGSPKVPPEVPGNRTGGTREPVPWFPGSPGTQVPRSRSRNRYPGTGKSRERATTAPHDKHKSVQSRGACMH